MNSKKRPGKNSYQVEETEKTRTLVITPRFSISRAKNNNGQGNGIPGQSSSERSSENRLEEAVGLAHAIDIDVCSTAIVPIPQIKPSTLFGSGKVAELKDLTGSEKIELVVIDHALTPIQQRNLEREWSVKVLDRTGLILEIFGRRARTREGRLQVELAHLEYQKSRLVRSWTHLERQRGGVGFMGGPGETQIEADRRQLQGKIISIRNDLENVTKTRELHRKGRKKVPYPIVALVGYTNAGKSTLFNKLTGSSVHAEDLLFATLDPTMRELELPSGSKIILSDTVGFISDLPTTLIAAFRATLEEVLEADMILHVQDISHHDHNAQMNDVNLVLKELGIDPDSSDENIMHVWNKIDLFENDAREHARYNAERSDAAVAMISAETGQGCDDLLMQIDRILGSRHEVRDVTLKTYDGSLVNWLYENSEVINCSDQDNGEMTYTIKIAKDKAGRLNGLLASKN